MGIQYSCETAETNTKVRTAFQGANDGSHDVRVFAVQYCMATDAGSACQASHSASCLDLPTQRYLTFRGTFSLYYVDRQTSTRLVDIVQA